MINRRGPLPLCTVRKHAAILTCVLAIAVSGFSSPGDTRHHASPAPYCHARHSKWQPDWKHGWCAPTLHGMHSGHYSEPVSSCGYTVKSGTCRIWPGYYQGWVDLKNVEGESATDFEILLDVHGSTIDHGFLAEYKAVDDGYLVSAPFWLKYQHIPQGSRYRILFVSSSPLKSITPYIISINGVKCDQVPPKIDLTASTAFINTSTSSTLTLTADAEDNVAVRKVVYKRNGEVIGEATDAPFKLDINVTAALDGNNLFTATAYDPSGNHTSTTPVRVFVSLGNKFFGTAPGGPEDFVHLFPYFNQVTPENAGKWGSVERERDVMNWEALDSAYYFARNNGIPFKYHTVIWGNQQPGWIKDLPVNEQLEEINEWMSEIAARYPDLEMVEPVNEPLHTPPSYIEALDGKGETGYDWVITAFELARKYFPDAQLILNDYQILQLESFTRDYLDVIHLLQERNLIDAIGVQAHFLERAEVPVVAANLQLLATTGLPIYISEFDLNFADDARQANVMRDLFTVFWNQPAVAGITYWGHQQGSVWRTNAYLVRSDNTTRPALDWVMCYLAGDGESNCTVPEYIPEGWHGDEFGVTLEAEAYDTGKGIVALGEVVAYTDDKDWIGFYDVTFQESWNTFWLTYAKGNEDTGSISVHIDNLEGAPVLTVPLPPTAGWGSATKLELAWNGLSGAHNIFITFNDADGVANLDNVRFGKPRPPSLINLIPDGGFESGISGWSSWDGTSLSVSTNQTYAGSQSLLATKNGGAQFAVSPNIGPDLTAGTTYDIRAQVFNSGVETSPVQMTCKLACTDQDDAYKWIASADLKPGEWTEVSGKLVVPEDCSVKEARVYFENATAGTDIYLDEIWVSPPGGNLIERVGFETGISGWSAWDGTGLSVSTDQAYEGSQSLLAAANGGAQFAVSPDLSASLTPGSTYTVKAEVFVSGPNESPVQMTCKRACDGENDVYTPLNNITGAAGVWTEISGTLSVPDACSPTEVRIYFENATAGVDIYIDAVSINAD